MRDFLRHLWLGRGAVYLLMCLAGLAVGFWPEYVWPIRADFYPAALPTLQTLTEAQILFFLLVWPVLRLRQREPLPFHHQGEGLAGLFIMTIPFYFVCCWFGDVGVTDCIRSVLVLLVIAPVGLGPSGLIGVQRFRGPVMLGLLSVVLGLPGVFYFLREFYPQIPLAWLWQVSPAGLAWNNAAYRELNLLPQPTWAFAFWAIISGAVAVLATAGRESSELR